jgi:hypothetical protein
VITGTMVDANLACYVHGARLLAAGRRDEATAAFELVRSRSHWSSQAHLAAEAALARLKADAEAGPGTQRGSK